MKYQPPVLFYLSPYKFMRNNCDSSSLFWHTMVASSMVPCAIAPDNTNNCVSPLSLNQFGSGSALVGIGEAHLEDVAAGSGNGGIGCGGGQNEDLVNNSFCCNSGKGQSSNR